MRHAPTAQARRAPCAGIPRMPTARVRVSCLSVSTAITRSMRIWWGHLSIVPDAPDDEAKAAQLQRYAELRWSLDARPALQGWVFDLPRGENLEKIGNNQRWK